MWKKNLDKIRPYIPGKPVSEVKREMGLDRIVKLASNENPRGPSPKAVEAMMKEVPNVNRYPDGGCFYLRKTLSEKLSIDGDNIVFGNGSDEIILMAVRAFVEAGDEVIMSDPTFLMYKLISTAEDACLKTVPCKDFKYDLDGMLEAITDKTKIIFIANPENPTGSYIPEADLKSFVDKVPENILIFIDEAYYDYAKGGDYPETLDLFDLDKRNMIITRTFSKAYSLAGLRVGYGVMSNTLAEVINKVRDPFNVNSIAQVAAAAAIKDTESLVESVNLVLKEKERFCELFKLLEIKFIPSRTNFILLDTKRSSEEVFEYLLKNGVVVRDMSAWGLDGYIRVNIGLTEENDVFFEVFTRAMKDIPAK